MPQSSNFDVLLPLFISLMKRIREYCDDDPTALYDVAKRDEELRKLCVKLNKIADELQRHERLAEQGILAPVTVPFRKEWNDYTDRWHRHIVSVWHYDVWPDIADFFRNNNFQSVYINGSEEEISKKEAADFKYTTTMLRDVQLSLEEDSDQYETVSEVIDALEKLHGVTRFSLRGAVERSEVAPVALVPPITAGKITNNRHLSLYHFWNEARKAYICGAPNASMAMARATLELLLRDVHNAKGHDLEDMIQYMKKNSPLPGDVMHRIQKVGNAILHGFNEAQNFSAKRAAISPTITAMGVLIDLKRLIETP